MVVVKKDKEEEGQSLAPTVGEDSAPQRGARHLQKDQYVLYWISYDTTPWRLRNV